MVVMLDNAIIVNKQTNNAMLKPVHGVGDDDDDVNGCNDDMIVDKTLCNHCFNAK